MASDREQDELTMAQALITHANKFASEDGGGYAQGLCMIAAGLYSVAAAIRALADIQKAEDPFDGQP